MREISGINTALMEAKIVVNNVSKVICLIMSVKIAKYVNEVADIITKSSINLLKHKSFTFNALWFV